MGVKKRPNTTVEYKQGVSSSGLIVAVLVFVWFNILLLWR